MALFSTALAPLSSEVAFGLGLRCPGMRSPRWRSGRSSGFLISPIARHVLDFHKGYNLYNIGFAAGLIGTVAMSGLKAFDVPLAASFHWAETRPSGRAAVPRRSLSSR